MKLQNQHHDRGFTLIELLVVISIIALLIGILLPALASARATARTIVCGSTQKGIGQGMFQYSLENKDRYPGPNTSGAAYRRFRSPQELFGMQGDTTPTTPTTVWDWMSPILGDSMSFSPNRAERTAQIFNDLACPESRLFVDSLYGGWPDQSDFERVFEEGRSYQQTSYLTPGPFHYYSAEWRGTPPSISSSYPNTRYWDGFANPATAPKSFTPQIPKVGIQPSQKIFVADGTRYLAQSGGGLILDFDISPTAKTYSSFGTSTPIFKDSTAYGRDFNPNSNLNAELSMRHNDGINAVHFDGHVESMGQQEAYSNPNPWYPGGSIFTYTDATPEAVEFMRNQQGDRAVAKIQ